MASNDVTETNNTSGNRPSRVSITGRPSIVRPPGSNPLPGAARGFPVAVSGRGTGRVRNVRRVIPVSNSRGKAYSDYETNLMLDIVEEILPHGQEMWVRCAEVYQSRVEQGYEVRDAESLRAKFKTLRLVKKPTGDPICPPNVVRAKRLMSAIENKMGVTDFDDEPLLNDNEPTKSSKKFIELDGNSSDSSDDNDFYPRF
jgi:hypothetical protein